MTQEKIDKLYFAKHLPVEGEIKEGDHYLFNNNNDIATKDVINEIKLHSEGYTRAKLFLCSRDIKVGDKVQGTILTGDNVYVTDEQGYNLKENIHNISLKEAQIMDAFKVIGEISPEAIWVKEGDEFNITEFRDRLIGWSYNKEVNRIEIRCSQCGHFH